MENKIANNLSIPVYVYLTQICSTSSLFLPAAHYQTQLYLNVCVTVLYLLAISYPLLHNLQ